ncbi:TPCN3 [Cordylochernes scorpioides]|uniref:TPCN3 n=1 Tax=Cordylochernes scorpioides TaxID=51811 RepID=A0ABY6K798_9ARAC|nr:TPCN3 [Cordylochernes scorpioides]
MAMCAAMAAAIDPAARKRESIKATILGSQGSAATESVAFSSQGSSISMPHGEISSSAKEMFKSSAQEQDRCLSQDLVLASTLVLDAKRGLHSDYEKTEKCVKRYLLYQHSGFKYALYVLLVVHHMVAVFEKPAVTGYELPYGATMAVEGLCLMFYLIRLVHAVSFLPLERFWRDKKNASQLVMILLTIIDMAVYIGLTESGHSAYAIRWSRLLRPLLFVNISENKQIRRAFRNIRKTLADIFRVLLLFYFFLGLFSLMALKLYDRKNLKNFDGSPYFNNYFDIFFNLYILVTTANNPDVMSTYGTGHDNPGHDNPGHDNPGHDNPGHDNPGGIPAYEDNRWSALFFIVYLVVCLYVFMNIILAVIYSNYRNNLKNEVLSMIQMRRDSLSQAFDILKEPSGTEGEYVVSLPTFQALMRKVLPRASPVTINILWFLLGQSPDSITISKEEFFQLADLLNVGVSEYRKRETIFHRMCPKLYHSKVSIVFKKIVAHRFFRHAFDALILLNAFLIAWDRNEAEWFFLAIFTFEIAAKVYTFGAREFFSKMWNW